jgi:hypothetical protein
VSGGVTERAGVKGAQGVIVPPEFVVRAIGMAAFAVRIHKSRRSFDLPGG